MSPWYAKFTSKCSNHECPFAQTKGEFVQIMFTCPSLLSMLPLLRIVIDYPIIAIITIPNEWFHVKNLGMSVL
jgi:hypothetical protein